MLVEFHGWQCRVACFRYPNGRTALQLVTADDDVAPVATATVNVPEIFLAPDEVLIKDYAENAGILAVLVQAGIVALPARVVPVGFVTRPSAVSSSICRSNPALTPRPTRRNSSTLIHPPTVRRLADPHRFLQQGREYPRTGGARQAREGLDG
jgi:hypothetical protein